MAKRNNYPDKIIGLGYVSWMNRAKWRSPQERRWLRLLSTLNEFQARLFAADKAWDQGRGGISRMSEMGYPVESGSHYPLWFSPSAMFLQETGATSAACWT